MGEARQVLEEMRAKGKGQPIDIWAVIARCQHSQNGDVTTAWSGRIHRSAIDRRAGSDDAANAGLRFRVSPSNASIGIRDSHELAFKSDNSVGVGQKVPLGCRICSIG